MNPTEVNQLLRGRRAIFPKMYDNRPIPRPILEDILENANWAPTHRLTEPWRFVVFEGVARERLGKFLAARYRETVAGEQFSELKYRKNLEKPTRSGAVIAICMQRDSRERVPEWEELAAVACSVQNMWLSCHAHGIGCYWSSTSLMLDEAAAGFLDLKAGQRCLGLFYMGYYEGPALPGKRTPIAAKTSWLDQ